MSHDHDRNDGPRIVRPIPRRPFGPSLAIVTPPEDETTPATTPGISAHDLRFLDPNFQDQSTGHLAPDDNEGSSLSRAASYMNLTASTLFGIYAPTSSGRDRFDDGVEPATPWGTGAMTPAKRPSVDEITYELMRARAGSFAKRRQSGGSETSSSEVAPSDGASILSITLRTVLLFALGMGYGTLVTHLSSRQNLSSFAVEDILPSGLDWRYIVLWGVAGVLLGGLLPWFDRVWEETMASRQSAVAEGPSTETQRQNVETDWALVVRGIGAFVGIVFAIRRLPWASTLQVSITLALANPFLWYLIDRSKPGFLLSAAISVSGCAVLIGLSPGAMPVPAGLASAAALHSNGTRDGRPHGMALLASQETLETAIWMLSVLFCTSVCFGNIGRRLALNGTSTVRGRWAGVQ